MFHSSVIFVKILHVLSEAQKVKCIYFDALIIFCFRRLHLFKEQQFCFYRPPLEKAGNHVIALGVSVPS